MGLFKKGRNRSQSTISVTSQPLLHDSDHDAFFLPGNNHVYLTHSKDGKPALGRKKPNNVLQDFGFDILGQSFGIPSRRDYESLASQSSGLITAPATPRPRQEAQRPNVNRQAYSYEDTKSPTVRRKTSSARSSSSPATTTMVQYSNPDISNSQRHNTYRTSSPFLGPQASNQYHIPPPPPPPSAVNWHRHPIVNTGVAPIPMSYYGAATRPIPSYPYNGLPMPHGTQNWANPQHHMMAQYPNALGVIMPQPVAMPMMPHHQQLSQAQSTQIPYNQALPADHPLSRPPPPPPQYYLRACAMTTKKEEIPQQETNHVSSVGKVAKQHKEVENVSRSATQAQEKLKITNDIKEHVSKRIFHVHVCAGCGKKRSSRYQKEHPLKRGEVPALNYCYNCLKEAADGDCDSFDRNAVHNTSKENRREATVPWPSSDEDQAILDGKYAYKQSRRGSRRVKSKHFGPLQKLFSRRAPPGLSGPPPMSLSSAEESSSRASSHVSDLCAVHSVRRNPVSQSRRTYEKKSDGTIQEEVKTSASPRQRYSSVNSWIEKQNSPLIPAENEPNTTNDKDKVRTASNSKPILTQPRSRIPRPRPPPTLIDFDNPFQAADDSTRNPSEERSSPYLYTNGVARMAPTSYLAGLNQVVLNETHPAKPANTRDDTKKGRKKGGISSSKVANPANARVAQGTHLKTPTSDCLRTQVLSNEKANSSTDPFIQGFRSAGSWIPLDWSSGIDPEQPAGFNPLPNIENSARWSVNDNAAAAPYEPLTPKDVPYAGHIYPPRVVKDSWSDFHTDLEREAEEMAERDLAFAGKLFDSLSGSLGGSATSAFPTTSFVTRSNISIVSCNSDSDHSDNDTTTPSVKEAEVQNDVDGTEANKSIERIEFSSEEERQNSARLKTLADSSIAHHEHQDKSIKLPLTQSNNMNNQLENGQDDDDDVDWPPSPIGSSLVGHTGHSVDGLQNHASIQEGSATTRNCHHLRRFAWLPSA
ncbi:hypothetical protein EV127DRAFT_404145 [Xylaria flabelliformis]|nr:hypothetical protein EV127DRAFT_404145 [Xylaria flabelliformis]